ncbi:MAG: bifunctional ornithine acetyltransferase/N-acetylglutamate synthase [Chloroflexota bacterium]
MTTISKLPIPASSADLPTVERRPVIPAGFKAGGLAAGIKASGRPDLAVIVSTGGPAAAAAVFTPNTFAAAPVRLSRANLAATSGDPRGGFGWAEAIISTSGSANAATGAAGDTDQLEIGAMVAAVTGVALERTLHLSTGIIGTRLPLDLVRSGLAALVPTLTADDDGWLAVAGALRTTDSTTKVATTTVDLPRSDGGRVAVTVSGIAKGVGMIHPRMATMLSVILTDAAVAPETLWGLLRPAAARTWNQLSVDGDTSTNDTVFVLASGASGAGPVEHGSAAAAIVGAAIEAVARDLARQQAADGEGASTLITAAVTGARDDAEARAIARSVISSSLVKAAAHGRDPNWGRIAGAAGNARLADAAVLEAAGLSEVEAAARAGTPAVLDPTTLRIAIAGHLVFDGSQGGPVAFDRAAAREAMNEAEVVLSLDLGLGAGSGEAFGCDLTEAYVVENSEYTT